MQRSSQKSEKDKIGWWGGKDESLAQGVKNTPTNNPHIFVKKQNFSLVKNREIGRKKWGNSEKRERILEK